MTDPPDLLAVKVEVKGYTYEENLRTQMEVNHNDPEALNRAMIEAPARFAWWAHLEAKAAEVEDALKEQMEDVKSRLHRTIEERMTPAEGRGPTLDTIKAEMRTSQEFQALNVRLLKIRADLGAIKASRKSLEFQKDMLLGVASNLRAELDGRMSLKERRADAEQARARAHAARPGHLRTPLP